MDDEDVKDEEAASGLRVLSTADDDVVDGTSEAIEDEDEGD